MIMATLKDLEASHTMDFKDYLTRDWNLNPSYVWIRRSPEKPEECLRVSSVNVHVIMLEKGRWMAPIPVHDRRNRRMCLPTRCLLYTSPSPRDQRGSRMPSSA